MLLQYGCDETLVKTIEELLPSLKKQRGVVNNGKPQLNRIVRDCFVYVIHDKTVHDLINKLMECDKSSISVMEYGLRQHYLSWHQDNSGQPNDLRKKSMSMLLNNDFEGGKLEFKIDENISQSNLHKPGDYVIFDSLIRHRVTRVTQGIRKSLVCWAYA